MIMNQKMRTTQLKRRRCNAGSMAACLIENCKRHPQVKINRSNSKLIKTKPTKFYRYPYPICWYLAGNQFLSAIDWPKCFYEHASRNPEHIFSRLFKTIMNAKLDVSGSTFKAAPTASLFINSFKTNLKGKEIDWSLKEEQDASEFVITMIGNMTLRTRADPKAFFQQNAGTSKQIINFIRNNLSITQSNEIHCNQCHERWLGGGTFSKLLYPYLQLKFPGKQFHSQSIQKLINYYQSKENLSKDYKCGHCGSKQTCAKQLVFCKPPKYIMIGIDRNYFDKKSRFATKITNPVKIDRTITIKLKNQQEAKYRVRATLDHRSQIREQGHWTCTKHQQTQLFNCDDDHSKPVKTFDQKETAFLLYEIKTVTKQKNSSSETTTNQEKDVSKDETTPQTRHERKLQSKTILHEVVKRKRKIFAKRSPPDMMPPIKKQRVTTRSKRKRQRQSDFDAHEKTAKRQRLNQQQSKQCTTEQQQQMRCMHCGKHFNGRKGL